MIYKISIRIFSNDFVVVLILGNHSCGFLGFLSCLVLKLNNLVQISGLILFYFCFPTNFSREFHLAWERERERERERESFPVFERGEMKFFILFLIEVKCTKISSLCYMFAPGDIHEYMLWLAKVLNSKIQNIFIIVSCKVKWNPFSHIWKYWLQ